MAIREFNGSSDYIQMNVGGLNIANFAQGNYTWVGVAKPVNVTQVGKAIGSLDIGTSNWLTSLQQSNNNIGIADDVNEYVGGGALTAVWSVVASTKATGTTSVGFHMKPLGSGSWTHGNTGATTTAGVAGTPNRIEIGAARAGAFSSNWGGRLAVLAVFNKVLSDLEIEGIETAKTTQSIYNLTPLALWDLNQASTGTAVTDLIGTSSQNTLNGTTVVTGDDPTGWTFGVSSGVVKAGSGIVGP